MRICSLLPSATEIVCALGLEDQLVAVTHECDYPAAVRTLPQVTRSVLDHEGSSSRQIHEHISRSVHQGSSIYRLDQALLQELAPDLILTQELCQVCAVSYRAVRETARILPGKCTVLSLEPRDLNGVLESISAVAELTGVPDRGQALIESLRGRIQEVAARIRPSVVRPRVFAVEWLEPLFVGGHWVPEMIETAGGIDGLGKVRQPSFVVSRQEVESFDPEVLVLMPCGFDLKRTVAEYQASGFSRTWHDLQAVRTGRVFAVDGSSYFNRPGPRLVDGLEILAEILHPDLFPRRPPPDRWEKLPAASSLL